MILVYSFIKRNQSRSVHKSWTASDVVRACNDLEMTIVKDYGMVYYASKEVPDESGINERKRIEQRFQLIARNFSYYFEGAY